MIALLALFCITAISAPVFCQSIPGTMVSDPAITIVPETLTARSGEQRSALLIVRNTTTDFLSDIVVSTLDSGLLDVDISAVTPGSTSIGTGASAGWIVRIENRKGEYADITLVLRVAYNRKQKNGSSIPQIAYATIKVTGSAQSQIADVKIETTLENLDQQHPGKAYITIVNTSDKVIRVKDIHWDSPDFIEIDTTTFMKRLASHPAEFIFQPYQTGAIPFTISAGRRVQPGKHLLVGNIKLAWGDHDERTRVITVTKAVDVGVLGESAVLKIFGVPSFLLIPGILVMAAWGLLWKWGVLTTSKDPDQLPLDFTQKPTDPQYWVVAITLSIVIVIAYRIINPDFLGRYGLEDLIIVWLSSIFIFGALLYVIVAAIRLRGIRRKIPADEDQPIDLLKKLGHQKLGISLRQANVTLCGPNGAPMIYRALMLQKTDRTRTTTWVGPPILVTFNAGTDANIQYDIANELTETGSPAKLAKLLVRHRNTLAVGWQLDENIVPRLTEMPTADVHLLKSNSAIVETTVAT